MTTMRPLREGSEIQIEINALGVFLKHEGDTEDGAGIVLDHEQDIAMLIGRVGTLSRATRRRNHSSNFCARQMKTFVIRCNDSVEAVVIGDEQFAREEMERLKEAHRATLYGADKPSYKRAFYRRADEFDAVVPEEEPETKEDDLGCFR